ncbi:toll/interleukin-1 receptor domain-containing protein [Frankia sp. Cppng1_Ct_nod]|uniref:toll/interleukin-1 receptor domain-containing protein n=1 Tax=Frankia sp. Cppng1_Ct_nod TaxID=2897162 RepID=UPI0013EF9696|nr:toll/interleukin-1 receptor domain-containing protein [Frankia sp. Cppng1_Ct_nod]
MDRPPRVFVSYAHGSPEHDDTVRDLWIFLRSRGIDAKLDKPAAERRQDWPLWMLAEVRAADHVLIIASPEYRRRAEGDAAPDEGRGVQFEAALIRDELYRDRPAGMTSVLVRPGSGGCRGAATPEPGRYRVTGRPAQRRDDPGAAHVVGVVPGLSRPADRRGWWPAAEVQRRPRKWPSSMANTKASARGERCGDPVPTFDRGTSWLKPQVRKINPT